MGFLNIIGKIGNYASRFVGRSGFIGSLASGVQKASQIISKVMPKVVNVAKKVVPVVSKVISGIRNMGIIKNDKVNNVLDKVSGVVGNIDRSINKTDTNQKIM